MKIEVLSCADALRAYLSQYNEDTCEEDWNRLVVEPYWDKLVCYSPIDLSERKPACVRNPDVLARQAELLEKVDVRALSAELSGIADKLPNYDDDPIYVFLCPLGNDNVTVNQRQNGVIGSALYGNILIQINPLIPGWEAWVRYVFAHEYCHTVWGNYWYNLHSGEAKPELLTALITDGEADSFASHICPDLLPQWLYPGQDGEIERLYREKYAPFLYDTAFDYSAFLFGSEEKGIPWCGGYAVGYRIVQKFLSRNRISFPDLMEVPPRQLI